MPPRLFVSYRPDDSQHVADRLFDRLEVSYGPGSVFMGVDSIDLGLDIAEVIEEELDRCEVLIALIGPDWAGSRDERGELQLHDPDDPVRIGISAALRRSIPVIPVLIDDASMPPRDSLPDDLAPLVRRQAVILPHPTFSADLTTLLAGLDRLLERLQSDGTPPMTSTPGSQDAAEVGGLSLDDVRNKRFRMARRSGYEVLEVDEFIDEVEEALAQMLEDLESQMTGRPLRGLTSKMTLDAVRDKRFRMARRSGYEVLEVDQFVDEIEETFALLYGRLSGRTPG